MSRVTIVLWAVVALLVVLLAGYVWGAAGRWAVVSELDRSRVQTNARAAAAVRAIESLAAQLSAPVAAGPTARR